MRNLHLRVESNIHIANSFMKRIVNGVIAFLLIACSTTEAYYQSDLTTKWDTLRVLKNPDKGWYHHLLDNGIDKYQIENDSLFLSFHGMDHLYLRLAWSYLEPVEGKYNWQVIDTIIDKYIPLGLGISFRITSKETGKYPGTVNHEVNGIQYATPYWVKQAGAKGTISEMWGTKSWVPDWDDIVYLEKLDNFQKAFAERYDGKSWLRYIDIGSIGEWGEGHTSFSTRIPPTVKEVKSNMDVFLRNYKKVQLICTDDLIYYGKNEQDVESLLEYALENGISLRDDSPLVNWYVKQNLKTWSVSHPQFYDPLYLRKPIVFELQHYSMVKDDGNWLGQNGSDTIAEFGYTGAEIMLGAIKTMHATYIGYHGYAEEWLKDNPDLTKELANQCGYWYFPAGTMFSKVLKKRDNIITMNWLNKGVAPAYIDYAIIFRLENTGNGQKTDFIIENAGNSKWLPDSLVQVKYSLNLDDKLPSGKYLLKFKLVKDISVGLEMIDIGLKKESFDKDGFVELGSARL